jgi:hypothetical protein
MGRSFKERCDMTEKKTQEAITENMKQMVAHLKKEGLWSESCQKVLDFMKVNSNEMQRAKFNHGEGILYHLFALNSILGGMSVNPLFAMMASATRDMVQMNVKTCPDQQAAYYGAVTGLLALALTDVMTDEEMAVCESIINAREKKSDDCDCPACQLRRMLMGKLQMESDGTPEEPQKETPLTAEELHALRQGPVQAK